MVDVEDQTPPHDAGLPRHVTTPLLTLITERSMDEDYAHVAARRAAGHVRARSGSLGVSTALVLTTFGVLAAIGGVQTSRDVDVQDLTRGTLLSEIDDLRSDVARVQRQVRTLSDAGIAATETTQRLEQQAIDQEDRLRRLEIRTGYIAVRGPGVRIEVSSAPDAIPRDEVRDADLALLVNGLFAAGAEAVGVNDERIIALGGISNTGRAVHINGRPLTAPYVIEAIGDRGTLQGRLLESSAGIAWFRVVADFGFRYEAQNVDEVVIPAARLVDLRHAGGGTDFPGRVEEEGVTP